MFEPAVTVLLHCQQEKITVEIFWLTEEPDLLLAQLRQVVADTCHVESAVTVNGNCMRNTRNFKLANMDVADFDRVIDKFGVVADNIRTKFVRSRL